MISFRRLSRLVASLVSVALLSTVAVRADEGMWTLDNFPSKAVAAKYGFEPSKAWLDHVRTASLLDPGGCSASFVSPDGLVMTNHHCVLDCVQQLSTAGSNYVQDGFVAKSGADEKPCPAFELDALTRIDDVTAQIATATAGKSGAAANRALRVTEAALQQACGTDASVRCTVVSLYRGGVYDLYHYKRYTDVRLVFAPEFDVAQFGGDPDNFTFPRYDFDIGLLRVYDAGKPLTGNDYFRWSANGSKAGDLTFVSGNPGRTERELTVAQLAYARDRTYPAQLRNTAEYIGNIEEFMTKGPTQEREGHESLFYVENEYKADIGREGALLDPRFFAKKVAAEAQLRAAVAAKPGLQLADGSAWDEIAALQPLRSQLAARYAVANNFIFQYGIVSQALTLVRAAAERQKPNGERLPRYTDQRLAQVREQLAAQIPIFNDLEELRLTYELSLIRQQLGTDDPLTQKILGTSSPAQLAHALVTGTHLDHAAVRTALYDGGAAALAKSNDPLITFVERIDPDLRAITKDYETRIDAPTRDAAARIAKARFAIYGTTIDPDATSSERLTYGRVAGYEDAQGRQIAPYTEIGGLFNRATGNDPYVAPPTWLAAKKTLDLSLPMNLVTTNDIIGGNSGSPLIDRDADIVGLIFDGNIYSLGGEYGYDGDRNRAVSLDSRAILEGLRKVYHLDRIVSEIEAARH